MDILELMSDNDITLKKVATTKGGEWAGPCPFCGGQDRFRVWPDQGQSGRYWCRQCGKTGDPIRFLRDFRQLDFKEACRLLGRKPPVRTDDPQSRLPETSCIIPHDPLWQEKALAFVDRSERTIQKYAPIQKWLRNRGLKEQTILGARLGWNPEASYQSRKSWGLLPVVDERGKPKDFWIPSGLVVPHYQGDKLIKVRIRRFDGEPKYLMLVGSKNKPMMFGDSGPFIIVESDLDGLLIQQEAGDIISAISIGSVQVKPTSDVRDMLQTASIILVALDTNEEAGVKGARWWTEQFPNAVRWPVISGKDPSEAFIAGVNIRTWVQAGLPVQTAIKPKSPSDTTSERVRPEDKETEASQGREKPHVPQEIKNTLDLQTTIRLGSPLWEEYEERAAIMEFQGGLTRAEAETMAMAIIGKQYADA
jgi:DNA primase